MPACVRCGWVVFGLGAVITACQIFRPSGAGRAADSGEAFESNASARVEVRNIADHPPISRVERSGDPRGAVAVAAAHDYGSAASVAVSALVETRLAELGFADARSQAHDLGFQVAVLVDAVGPAARFVSAATQVLSTPVRAQEPALAVVGRRLQGLRARRASGAAEAAVDTCSGELLLTGAEQPSDSTTAQGVARLEAWRRAVYSASAASFAVLGERALLDAATSALGDTPAWPSAPAPSDPWPARDVVGVDPAGEGSRRLTIALRVAEPARAISAAKWLGRRGATLSTRLAALREPWELERVVGTSRPRGGCVRADVAAPEGDPGPDVDTVAAVALVTLEELQTALASAPHDPSVLDESVLRSTDPRSAAGAAAWRALTGRLQSGPQRRFISFAAHSAEAGAIASVTLHDALERTRTAFARPTFEQKVRVEAGQGELWLLLASQCGTASEGESDAGLGALVVRALAAKQATSDVALEPWVHGDGIGLLAHGPRRNAESPRAHAQRIASTLAYALAAARITGPDLAHARASLLEEIGPEPEPGYWLALSAAAPGHPSWLEPRGTWQSISDATLQEAETRRRALLAGPLRLGVIANVGADQAQAAAATLQRWLRPLRDMQERCPEVARAAGRPGVITIETSGEPGIDAYVVVPLASASPALDWTVFLLNRQGGFLEHSLRLPGLASARAVALGSNRAGALLIALDTLEAEPEAAVAQARALLERLAQGAISAADLAAARRSFEELSLARSLDPRQRILKLWRGAPTERMPALPELLALTRQLDINRHIVVQVKRR